MAEKAQVFASTAVAWQPAHDLPNVSVCHLGSRSFNSLPSRFRAGGNHCAVNRANFPYWSLDFRNRTRLELPMTNSASLANFPADAEAASALRASDAGSAGRMVI